MPPRQYTPHELLAAVQAEDNDGEVDSFWGLFNEKDMLRLYDLFAQRIDWHRVMADAYRLHINTQRTDETHSSGPIDFKMPCGICMVQALMDPYAATSARAKEYLKWSTDEDYNHVWEHQTWEET